jgi:nucleoside-diphosphate-sugar epimerase
MGSGINIWMRILVIGGTGFIGPWVVTDLIRRDNEVAVFHRGSTANVLPSSVRHITGDRRAIADAAAHIRAFHPDVVIDVILSSARQARDIMNIVRGVARRIVVISSIDVYRACGVFHGLEPGPLEPLPLTEESPVRSQMQTYPAEQISKLQQVFGWLDDEYDKIPVERAVLSDPELRGTVLRLPMVYGPGDPLHRFFPLLKRMDDRRPAILFEEKLAQWRGPRGYVENVAAAISLAATSDRATGRVYNVAESKCHSELEWTQKIARAAHWAGEFVIVPGKRAPAFLRNPGNLDQHWVADSGRIRGELDYREPIDSKEAIEWTIAWERSHPPPQIDASRFDYAAEDAVLAELHH